MADLALSASFELFPRDQGGRKSPVRSGYRPALWFGDTDPDGELRLHSCIVHFHDRDTVSPGESVDADLAPVAFETWPTVAAGAGFDVFDGARPVGRGRLAARPEGTLASVEMRRALHRAFEDWVTERFGSKVERAGTGNSRLRPDLVGWFRDGVGERRSLVVEVIARRPWRLDVDRLARMMKERGALLGIIVALDEPSLAVRNAVHAQGSVDLGRGQHVPRVRILTIRDLVTRDVSLLPGPVEPQELQLAAV
ncbi:MAG: hypothetical protein JWN10_1364 [Solirubrobacterales bacterium]|nr:hypothetical protein [Solirubrobacterales bacterium]